MNLRRWVRPRKTLLAVLGTLTLAVLLVVFVVAWSPTGPDLTGATYKLTVEPPDRVHVRLTVDVPATLGLSFFRENGGPAGIGDLSAVLNGWTVPTVVGRQWKVLTFGRSGRLSLAYDVDPTWYPPGATHERKYAKSRLDEAWGFLRMNVVMLRSRRGCSAPVVLDFELPQGWDLAGPWPKKEGTGHIYTARPADWFNEYVALGRGTAYEYVVGDGSCLNVWVGEGVPGEPPGPASLVTDLFAYFTGETRRVIPVLSPALTPRSSRMSSSTGGTAR